MASLTAHKEVQRQPGELVSYGGASGIAYYDGMAVMHNAGILQGATQGISAVIFTGVVETGVNLTSGLGSSVNDAVRVYKSGEFTFDANGTGASADIGKKVYFLNNNTVGTSVALPRLLAGTVSGLPSTTAYRVRITNAVDRESEVA